MSLVLKLKKRSAASQAAPLAGESVPSVLPPLEPAGSEMPTLAPVVPFDDSHLVPCQQCGSPNGLSASSCWNCEANLLPRGPFRRGRSPWPATPTPQPRSKGRWVASTTGSTVPPGSGLSAVPAPPRLDERLPMPPAAVIGEHSKTQLAVQAERPAPEPEPEPAPMLAPGERPRTWKTEASILLVAGVAVGAFFYFNTSAPPDGAGKSTGSVATTPVATTPVNTQPAPAALAGTVPAAAVLNAPPTAAPTRNDALRALAVEPITPAAAPPRQTAAAAAAAAPIDAVARHSAPQPPATVALKATKAPRAVKARGAARASNGETPHGVAADRPAPILQAAPQAIPQAIPQPPAPVRAACTPTVAALGLCTAASTTQPKE